MTDIIIINIFLRVFPSTSSLSLPTSHRASCDFSQLIHDDGELRMCLYECDIYIVLLRLFSPPVNENRQGHVGRC